MITDELQVCNFTNAVFFWAILPETAHRPLEEMRYLFTEAPLFVPRMDKSQFIGAGQSVEFRVKHMNEEDGEPGISRA